MAHRRAVATLFLVGALAVACSRSDVGQPRADERLNVVLICIDTVRADRLGCYGYRRRPTTPALDALAARSLVFRNTTAPAGWTKPSVPSFFTGLYPIQHGVYEGSARDRGALASDVLPARVETLAEAFHAAGYETAAFVHNDQLRSGLGFEQGFDVYDDQVGDAREIQTAALDWIGDRPRDTAFLLYLHFLDAHWPYDIPSEYATLFADAGASALFRGSDSRALRDAVNEGTVVLEPAQLEALGALYDGALRFLDDELGRLFTGLAQRGLAERTVIAVVADHGEEFLEHDRIGHGHGLWENLLRVPWILHVPGRPAATIEAEVNLVDLPATLLGACHLAPERGSRSDADSFRESVDRLAQSNRPSPLFAEHKTPDHYEQSLRVGSLKLIRRWFPPPVAAADSPEISAPPLAVGERWEAEVEVTGDGTLKALQLKPRGESADDPPELKGLVTSLDGALLVVAGVPVRVGVETEWTGDTIAQAAGLHEGIPVKASGTVSEGTLLATRLKFYAPEGEFEPEIRGTVTAVEPGRVRLGEIPIAYDAATVWKDVPATEEPRPSLSRDALAVALELGSVEAGRRGWRVESALYDLARDPSERLQRDARPQDTSQWASLLDELGASLARCRAWSNEDRAALDAQATEALRALGYVR